MAEINIPRPPALENKSTEDYLAEVERWTHKIYDALRYISETGGSNDGNV